MRKLLLALVFAGFAFAQARASIQQKLWQNQAEYTVANGAATDSDPTSRLETLDNWTASYPASDYMDERLHLYLTTYEQLARPREQFDVAQRILQYRPTDLPALTSTIRAAIAMKPPAPAALDAAENAANLMLGDFFTAANQPPGLSDARWAETKANAIPFLQQSLATIRGLR